MNARELTRLLLEMAAQILLCGCLSAWFRWLPWSSPSWEELVFMTQYSLEVLAEFLIFSPVIMAATAGALYGLQPILTNFLRRTIAAHADSRLGAFKIVCVFSVLATVCVTLGPVPYLSDFDPGLILSLAVATVFLWYPGYLDKRTVNKTEVVPGVRADVEPVFPNQEVGSTIWNFAALSVFLEGCAWLPTVIRAAEIRYFDWLRVFESAIPILSFSSLGFLALIAGKYAVPLLIEGKEGGSVKTRSWAVGSLGVVLFLWNLAATVEVATRSCYLLKFWKSDPLDDFPPPDPTPFGMLSKLLICVGFTCLGAHLAFRPAISRFPAGRQGETAASEDIL